MARNVTPPRMVFVFLDDTTDGESRHDAQNTPPRAATHVGGPWSVLCFIIWPLNSTRGSG
jgi:hypothetical protein